ncbi:MAG TPA: NosD domain-containing protein, partial [bacterium]|nr:NosD domain-containing protein [bacterium]
SYTDTDISSGATYYYRIVAYDSHITNGQQFYNISWYSNAAQAIAPVVPYYGPNWYVNASTGNDTNNGSETYPFATITRALQSAAAYDTIYIAAGTYSETVVIDTDGISLIGADSMTTIIDPVGDSSVTNLYGIYAVVRNNLTINNLKVTDCYYGIYFDNVDSSIIDNVNITYCASDVYPNNSSGIRITNNSENNIIKNSLCEYNMDGLSIINSDSLIISNNNMSNNLSRGILLFDTATNIIVRDNILNNNEYGICVESYGETVVYQDNISNYNSNIGVYFHTSNKIQIFNNISRYNRIGYSLYSTNNSLLIDNLSANNTEYGIRCMEINNDTIINNRSLDNNGDGLCIENAQFLYIANNLFSGNLKYDDYNLGVGISISNLQYSVVKQNSCINNSGGAIMISGNTATDSITKNNFITITDTWIVSNTYDSANIYFNYFGLTDSIVIHSKIFGDYPASINFVPFRLNMIDTTSGVDIIAPAAPSTVSVETFVTGCTVSWSASNTNEEIGGALTDLAGYKIYRSTNRDTSDWGIEIAIVDSGTLIYVDTGVNAGETYYYRITAFDSHSPYPNESWYS